MSCFDDFVGVVGGTLSNHEQRYQRSSLLSPEARESLQRAALLVEFAAGTQWVTHGHAKSLCLEPGSAALFIEHS